MSKYLHSRGWREECVSLLYHTVLIRWEIIEAAGEGSGRRLRGREGGWERIGREGGPEVSHSRQQCRRKGSNGDHVSHFLLFARPTPPPISVVCDLLTPLSSNGWPWWASTEPWRALQGGTWQLQSGTVSFRSLWYYFDPTYLAQTVVF